MPIATNAAVTTRTRIDVSIPDLVKIFSFIAGLFHLRLHEYATSKANPIVLTYCRARA